MGVYKWTNINASALMEIGRALSAPVISADPAVLVVVFPDTAVALSVAEVPGHAF